MPTINKNKMYSIIAKETGIPVEKVRKVIISFIDNINYTLLHHNNVLISNIGLFEVKPTTIYTKVKRPPTYGVIYTPSKVLLDKLNNRSSTTKYNNTDEIYTL